MVSALCAILFALGGIYQENRDNAREIKSLKDWKEEHLKEAEHKHADIQEKQERKWGDIPEIEQRVDDLEEWKAWLEGYERIKNK
jgi:hypothetical protein